jgi:hypothetical protein
MVNLPGLRVIEGIPDISGLPWNKPLADWQAICPFITDAPKGLSRHIVIFLNYANNFFALKELHSEEAEKEYKFLQRIDALRLPVIKPVGFYQSPHPKDYRSILITQYLDFSIPYRTIFMQEHLSRYRNHLMDAMAGLLVQLHLSGVYWGDCSFSNTLFRRDAGMLQAYMVDAETVEFSSRAVTPLLRSNDLIIMEENLASDLSEIGEVTQLVQGIPVIDLAAYIRIKYQDLWDEVTREEDILLEDSFKTQERIRALNRLGFSVNGIELTKTSSRNLFKLKVVVSDRNYHRDLLYSLTGIDSQETQARLMMNELQELRAMMSASHDRNIPMSEAAYCWITDYYQLIGRLMGPYIRDDSNFPEIYCQVLEHKWFLSEIEHCDVGHKRAAQSFIDQFLKIEGKK